MQYVRVREQDVLNALAADRSHALMSPFLYRIQREHQKRRANPNAFTLLPQGLARQIGLRNRNGQTVLHAAVLAGFVALARQFAHERGSFRTIRGKFDVPQGRFISSRQTVAENLFSRYFGRTPDHDRFKSFHKRVDRSVDQLVKDGLLRAVGAVGNQRRGWFGTYWTFDGTPLEGMIRDFPYCPVSYLLSPSVFDYRLRADEFSLAERGDFMNVVDLLGHRIRPEYPELRVEPGEFTKTEACRSLTNRGHYEPFMDWMVQVAHKGAGKARFMSVGAFRQEDIDILPEREDTPVFFPFVVLDIDRKNAFDSFDVAQGIVKNMSSYGLDLSTVLVSHTGGRGFHIRIPSGALGNPVFRDRTSSFKVLNRFASQVADYDVDKNLFRAGQLIRMIGGRHKDSHLYCRAWTADEFAGLSIGEVLEACRTYESFPITNPLDAAPAPELIMALTEAADTVTEDLMPDFDSTPEFDPAETPYAVVERAIQGVAEGEEWFSPRGSTTHIGRNKAAWFIARHLLRRDEDRVAWSVLVDANRNNQPPLPRRELEKVFKSAQRYVARDRRHH